jgi:hypothetical protein
MLLLGVVQHATREGETDGDYCSSKIVAGALPLPV